eukprot:CAMPEP_0113719198 /NCGR_PEP_ID=MMETSP0038_2-20120614/35654_1 /TAXON_ID=2898 /ORGANISM="Cryptomonas paramecium" /LENGTH=81 /DNA_ID=CAMNT_0000647489 /DNA_START=226 /DNA_END=467 /DNA_ORIENTATION=- /assembly_acc=CAM_ASM_000170
MKGKSLNAWRLILGMGIVVEIVYAAVLAVMSGYLSTPLSILCFIATALQMVETAAYVLVVTMFRQALVDDQGPQQHLVYGS